jgi:hypothetical protein
MEAFTAIVGGAMELGVLWLYRNKRLNHAAMLGICVAVTQVYGTVLYFGVEAFDGFSNIDLGNPINFWGKFLSLNLIWFFAPLITILFLARTLLHRPVGQASGLPSSKSSKETYDSLVVLC